jgi:predicted dinucleotide-binding enzyme
MKIGIIGAGFMGRGLASLALKNGHEVMISNSRDPKTLMSAAIAIGCKVGTAEQAATFGDLVIVAIPLKNYRALPVQPLTGKIVVDANNYYPERDGKIAALETKTTTTSELLEKHLPASIVVKAFNAILQRDLSRDGRPSSSADRRALPIAGDDTDAKRIVTTLIDEFGFDVVDAGPLSAGWRFERAKPAYCVRNDVKGLKHALAAADRKVELPDGSWRR